jgi:hypothetical protein
MKVCSSCKRELPATFEYFHSNKKDGKKILYSICKDCKRGKYKQCEPMLKNCSFCGKPFQALRSTKNYCSRKCNTYANRNINFDSYKPRSSKKRKKCPICNKEVVSSKRKYCDECKKIKLIKKCVICGEQFQTKIYNEHAKYCLKCRNKDSIRKKKIFDEANNVYLSKAEIFQMEGYRCKHCGCNTDKKFGYIKDTLIPKPTAPTIDHIVPLNFGGTHTLKNVQLLCYKCNHEKQDGFLEEGEQLKMF